MEKLTYITYGNPARSKLIRQYKYHNIVYTIYKNINTTMKTPRHLANYIVLIGLLLFFVFLIGSYYWNGPVVEGINEYKNFNTANNVIMLNAREVEDLRLNSSFLSNPITDGHCDVVMRNIFGEKEKPLWEPASSERAYCVSDLLYDMMIKAEGKAKQTVPPTTGPPPSLAFAKANLDKAQTEYNNAISTFTKNPNNMDFNSALNNAISALNNARLEYEKALAAAREKAYADAKAKQTVPPTTVPPTSLATAKSNVDTVQGKYNKQEALLKTTPATIDGCLSYKKDRRGWPYCESNGLVPNPQYKIEQDDLTSLGKKLAVANIAYDAEFAKTTPTGTTSAGTTSGTTNAPINTVPPTTVPPTTVPPTTVPPTTVPPTTAPPSSLATAKANLDKAQTDYNNANLTSIKNPNNMDFKSALYNAASALNNARLEYDKALAAAGAKADADAKADATTTSSPSSLATATANLYKAQAEYNKQDAILKTTPATTDKCSTYSSGFGGIKKCAIYEQNPQYKTEQDKLTDLNVKLKTARKTYDAEFAKTTTTTTTPPPPSTILTDKYVVIVK